MKCLHKMYFCQIISSITKDFHGLISCYLPAFKKNMFWQNTCFPALPLFQSSEKLEFTIHPPLLIAYGALPNGYYPFKMALNCSKRQRSGGKRRREEKKSKSLSNGVPPTDHRSCYHCLQHVVVLFLSYVL